MKSIALKRLVVGIEFNCKSASSSYKLLLVLVNKTETANAFTRVARAIVVPTDFLLLELKVSSDPDTVLMYLLGNQISPYRYTVHHDLYMCKTVVRLANQGGEPAAERFSEVQGFFMRSNTMLINSKKVSERQSLKQKE